MSVAARAVETPKSRSMSRRVRRVRSSFSSWLMASGMARSHRGLGGILDPGQPVAQSYELGRFRAHMSFDMLVEGFTECKIRVPSFEGPIKGVMG